MKTLSIQIKPIQTSFRNSPVTEEMAPCKTKRVKDNSKEWFDSVVSERINNRDKL